jgi:hemoglobin-like flavoprotein
MNSDALATTLTPDQCRLVRESVVRLREHAAPLSLLFYGRLFELDRSASRLFHHDLAQNGRKVIDTLAAVADSLADFEAMRPRLAMLGRQHAEYGVRPEQYEIGAAALLWAISQTLGPDFDPRARQAWTLALAAVTAAMQGGAGPA